MHKITLENRKSSKNRKQIKKHFNTENVRKKIIKDSSYNNHYLPNKSIFYDKDKKEKTSPSDNTKDRTILKIAGDATVNEFSNLIGVSSTNVIRYCKYLGVMVTLNKQFYPELLSFIAYEYGYYVALIAADISYYPSENTSNKEDFLCTRAPIVTVMGHVDHGKTTLLDFIRKSNVIERESGGITQHIKSYNVEFKKGKSITFIDTPGHEAFSSMRSRGTKITDIIIIVIDAEDDIQPQTKEAISHAKAASLPIIFALNKIDKPNAQPNFIRKQLANMNILVEEWGGKYQSQEISAKTGAGIDKLLEKVWLEAEILGLMANPNKSASGTVIESTLVKGKGYLTNLLVQQGTIKKGDYVSSGLYYGKVKAIFDEFNKIIPQAGPSIPIQIMGLNGAPAAGEKFKVIFDEKGAKKKSLIRKQLQREQSFIAKKHLTLDEISRRITLTNFKEMNIILKGDTNGSVEALTDAIQNISTDIVTINIVHKGVGPISASDMQLARAAGASIIGFNVSRSHYNYINDNKNIDIRLYSVIYDAINDIKNHVNKIPSSQLSEQGKIIGKAEIRNIYNIKNLYTIAGCMVTYGRINRHLKIKLLREGIVIYSGELASLKRFKEDVKEVAKGYECGLNIKAFNDIKVGDIIDFYE